MQVRIWSRRYSWSDTGAKRHRKLNVVDLAGQYALPAGIAAMEIRNDMDLDEVGDAMLGAILGN